MKGKSLSTDDMRVIQFFLSPSNSPGPGIYEVSASKSQDKLSCNCPGFNGRSTCKHTKFVQARIDSNDGSYPMEISTKATKEAAKKATESNEAFRDFLLKYGKIEVC